MKQRIKLLVTSVAMVAAVLCGTVAVQANTVAALDPATGLQSGVNAAGGGGAKKANINDQIKTIINVLLFVLGAIAVIMIVIGGIRYTLSGGDGTSVTAAKNTILYAVVGLVVALLAFAIVNFVIDAFKP